MIHLIPISDIHSYNTGLSASGNFYRPKVGTNQLIQLWSIHHQIYYLEAVECIPPSLKQLNIEAFKTQYKQFLLSCLI
jgi:hypothetical protein